MKRPTGPWLIIINVFLVVMAIVLIALLWFYVSFYEQNPEMREEKASLEQMEEMNFGISY